MNNVVQDRAWNSRRIPARGDAYDGPSEVGA